MGKLNDSTIVNSINNEYVLLIDSNGLPVRISKNNLAEAIRSVMNEATENNKGLKSPTDVKLEKRMDTTVSRVIYESERTTSISTSLLISLAFFGGGPMALFYMTINRSINVLKTPTILLNHIGGASAPATPRFKVWSDESTGRFKIILERTQFTPAVNVKIMNTISPSTDNIPLTEVEQSEVDAATYIDVGA